MIHVCSVCNHHTIGHRQVCEPECTSHRPLLCCPGCTCQSFEIAHMPREEKQALGLLTRGYTEVTEWRHLSVGDRVRHSGERFPGASDGTATLERIFVRHETDVEVIARRDKPGFGPTDTHGFWASYHTVKTRALEFL